MLETRKVFIDTQSFVKAGLHFNGSAFESFRTYCKLGELRHISTSVVENEVRSKIQGSVSDAINAIKTFRRKARLLASLDDDVISGLFQEISDEDIYTKSESVFDQFLEACGTETFTANNVDAELLINMYFQKKAPFGEGKKKSEFPDAISLLTLKSNIDINDKVYIISEDSDLKAFCKNDPQLISVDSLELLLDRYTNHTNVRHKQVRQFFQQNVSQIKQDIILLLESCNVYNNSTWEGADVDHGLVVTKLGDIEPSILYIDDEESHISFEIDVVFEVSVTGPDFNRGTYDREEGRMFTFSNFTRTCQVERTFTVDTNIRYQFVRGNLDSVALDVPYIYGITDGIETSVEEDEPHW